MKRWIYNMKFYLLGMMALLGSACSDERIPGSEPDVVVPGTGEKEIPVMISLEDLSLPEPATYGTDYPGETSVGGSTSENVINDITVYIFNQSFECEKIIQASSSPTNPVMVKTGKKYFVAVANAQGKLTLPTTPSATNYTALHRMLTDADTLPESPFLMTGEAKNVPLPDELPSANPYNIPINVERTCAKVTLKVMKSGQSTGHTITLRKVTLFNGADRVALFEAPNPNPTTYSLSDTITSFDQSGVIPSSGYCTMMGSFYTYESLCGSDVSKAVRIEIESAVNSLTNIRTASFYLGEYVKNPGDAAVYDVKRNYWYDVTVNIVKPGMDSIYVTVNTCPWNLADVIQDTVGVGGQYETAIPFKLVKNYTAAELTGTNQRFAAINNHTKGASWIDVKVSKDAGWELLLKDNSSRNQGVIASADGGTTWTSLIYNNTSGTLKGTGNDLAQRIYIYRPYRENDEPELGPSLYIKLNGQYKWDFVVQPRDTVPIPTNCYIMRPQRIGAPVNETRAYIPLAGVYRVWEDHLMANGDSIPDGTITASLLWQDRNGVIKPSELEVINATKRDSAYIYAEAGEMQGNAVIAMSVGGVIYWSFHLWVTDYNPEEPAGQKLIPFSTTKNNIFMDRNLGALANDYDNNSGEARGLYYQFGRKDPFRESVATSSNALTGSANLRPLTAIPTVLQNPTTFYTNSSPQWPLQVEIVSLWNSAGGNKTAFDPCPDGWRVPKQDVYGSNPWSYEIGVNDAKFAYNAEAKYTDGRYYQTVGYYPLYGYISSPGSGITSSADRTTYYWSSWPNTAATTGTGMSISTASGGINHSPSIDKTYGAYVRCVKDED
jgi:uncharacterized protein (TIGR02145 family)